MTPLALFGFLEMSLADILDIVLLGLIIFFMFKWIKDTSAMSIFIAIVSLYVIRVLVGAFNMRLMVAIMDMVLDVGVLALIVIFQPEIRRFLIRLGNRYMSSTRGKRILNRILGRNIMVFLPMQHFVYRVQQPRSIKTLQVGMSLAIILAMIILLNIFSMAKSTAHTILKPVRGCL